jgi:hypothetical protein
LPFLRDVSSRWLAVASMKRTLILVGVALAAFAAAYAVTRLIHAPPAGPPGMVRRLRQEDPQLPAHREGLKLHGAPVSPAEGNPRRDLEVPGGTAGEVDANTQGDDTMRTRTILTACSFVYFRIYGPEKAALDGSWQSGDFEEVK